MNYGRGVRILARRFEEAGLEAARRQAEWIIQEVTGSDRARVIAHPDREIDPDQWHACELMARRRLRGEPLQYILGYSDFYGLRLRVTPDVLIPRPETEQLVEHVLDDIADLANPRILDVGTGSGCIALALKRVLPSASLWACDIDAGALRVAYWNSRSNHLPLALFQCDALKRGFATPLTGVADVVVSNPPYVADEERAALPREVGHYEPQRALFAHPDPISFYKSIAEEAASILRPNGRLFFEVHEDRMDQVIHVLGESGFSGASATFDYTMRARIASARLVL